MDFMESGRVASVGCDIERNEELVKLLDAGNLCTIWQLNFHKNLGTKSRFIPQLMIIFCMFSLHKWIFFFREKKLAK